MGGLENKDRKKQDTRTLLPSYPLKGQQLHTGIFPWRLPGKPLFGLLSPDDRNFLRLQSDGRREGQYARLISPPVHLPRSPVCMEFQYQATGGRGVALQVLREASQESKLLWVIREDQGGEWKHGRIILPSYDMEYQVGWWREAGAEIRGSPGDLYFNISKGHAHSSLGNVVKHCCFHCVSHVAMATK